MEVFLQSFWGFWSSIFPPTSCHGCPEIYFLCLQAEGGKKAEAVATVVAAVDLARVRLPEHAEDGLAEEEEAVEAEIRQQGREMTEVKHIVETKTLPAELPAVVSVASERHRVQVSQVGGVSFILEIIPDNTSFLTSSINSVGYSRFREQQNSPPMWTLVSRRPQFHISQFLKFPFLNTSLATR